MSDCCPIQRQWIWDWFASDGNLYVTYIVTITAIMLHPILFGLHLYRKVIKTPENEKSGPKANARTGSRMGSATGRTGARSVTSNGRASISCRNKTDKEKAEIMKKTILITTLTSIVFGWIA
eukprot:190978_1